MSTLIGPTHHFGGLSLGNLASMKHKSQISNPKEAALESLKRMELLHKLGVKQLILPPLKRPFRNSKLTISEQFSAAYMWTANSATHTPSFDARDEKCHLTPANLKTMPHRAIETNEMHSLLKKVFNSTEYFKIHDPIDKVYGDEGAANTVLFTSKNNQKGLHLFVYGEETLNDKFPTRQSKESFEKIIKMHQLSENKVVFAKQNPLSINAGVFHNDVISVGIGTTFLCHEKAFENQQKVISELQKKAEPHLKEKLTVIEIKESDLSLNEAVSTYLFNSQLVNNKNEQLSLIAPMECKNNNKTLKIIERILNSRNQIEDVHFVNLNESMKNGGGPACLRLQLFLNKNEYACIPDLYKVSDLKLEKLAIIVEKYFPSKCYFELLNTKEFIKTIFKAQEYLYEAFS